MGLRRRSNENSTLLINPFTRYESNDLSMNILLATSDNNPYSGAFICAANLAAELNVLGHTVLVMLPGRGEGSELLDQLGVEHMHVRTFNWAIPIDASPWKVVKVRLQFVVNVLYSIPRICKVCRSRGIDIVHINTSWAYAPAMAARLCGIPVVWHIRELLEEGLGRKIFSKSFGYRLMERSRCIVAISNEVAEKYRRVLHGVRIERIYDGIDPRPFITPRDQLFSAVSVRMTMVGAVKQQKGQHILIDAIVRLSERESPLDFTLTIVGRTYSKEDEEYQRGLLRIVNEHELADRVRFVGPSRHPEEYLLASDIAFMCSEAEAFGRVTVEAMMAGCVVIGARHGGTVEIIKDGETGFLFERDCPNSLVHAIETVLSNKRRSSKVASEGRRHALAIFTARHNAKEVSNLYHELLENSDTDELSVDVSERRQ